VLAKSAIPIALLLPIVERSIVMTVSVCLSVCMSVRMSLREHISGTTHPIFAKCYVHVRGLVLLWQHSDTLCISGFTDDVIFAHKPRLLDVALN